MELRIRYRRYRALWDVVWQQLPGADQTAIEGELRFVTDKLADFVGWQRRANAYGMAARTAGGLKVLLRHKFLLTLDDRFVMGVMAHELAHVLCRHPLDGVLWTSTPREAFLWAEAEANALAQAWGFSPPSILTGHWATTEYHSVIMRCGLDFTPVQVQAASPQPHPAARPNLGGTKPGRSRPPVGAERVIQARFEFPERTVVVA